MPRPQKHADQRRGKRLEIRLTTDEIKSLISYATSSGMTLSDFIRHHVLAVKPRVQQAPPERAAFIKGLAHLGKIGGNVNQIAKALNSDLAIHQRVTVSGENISATLYAIQTLAKNLLKHLTDGHTR